MFRTIFRAIDKLFNPYRYMFDDEETINDGEKKFAIMERLKGISAKQIVEGEIEAVHLVKEEQPIPVSHASELVSDQPFDYVFWYQNNHSFQVVAKFPPNAYNRYQHRSGETRRKLRPRIYPIEINQPFDRTHVIPVGYHGSESNNVLLVGWDSHLNRQPMNAFEQQVRSLNNNQAVIWHVELSLQQDQSVKWTTTILNEYGKELAKASWHDESKFKWKLET